LFSALKRLLPADARTRHSSFSASASEPDIGACKQWKTWNVGGKPVCEFLGALTDAGIQRGIFITLAGYTGDAKQLAEKHGIEIVNESDLVPDDQEERCPG
jgi:hypothetical protein